MEEMFRDIVEHRCANSSSSPPPALSFGGSSSSRSTDISTSSNTTSPAYDWAQIASTSSSDLPTPSGPFSLPGSYFTSGSAGVGEGEKRNGSSSRTSTNISASSSPPASPSSVEGLPQPYNFGIVANEVYRSSFPRAEHFPFLRTLGLKTVLVLVLEDYPQENRDFFNSEGIEIIQLGMPNNKDPLAKIPADTIRKALSVVLDRRKHPLLIHCNRGKHRTGCLVGCLRKMQRWSGRASLEEYAQYAHPKERVSDQDFISAFVCEEVWMMMDRDWLPQWVTEEMCCLEVEQQDDTINATAKTGERVIHVAPLMNGDVSCEDLDGGG